MPVGPYGIAGTVTLDGTAVVGGKIWARSLGYHVNMDTVKNITYFYTDGAGHYLIDVANIASAVTNADTVRVYCEVDEIATFADVTIDTTKGGVTQNFTLVAKSGFTDGLKNTTATDGTGELLHNQLTIGLKDGMV